MKKCAFIKTLAITGLCLTISVAVNAAETTESVSVTKTVPSPGSDVTTTYTSTSSTTIPNPVDQKITSSVYSKYAKEPALIGTNVSVNVDNGVVSLTGTVTSQSQADQAVITAKSVDGVKDVRSYINVTTNPPLYKTGMTPNY